MAQERTHRRLAAILAADVVGYSRLMGEDEAGTLAALKQLRMTLVDPIIAMILWDRDISSSATMREPLRHRKRASPGSFTVWRTGSASLYLRSAWPQGRSPALCGRTT
jgi:hypothetical protein